MKCLVTLLFSLPFVLSAQVNECDSLSPMNVEIVKVLTPKIGKKIDRGECWDVAKFALDATHAKWDGLLVFGRLYDPKAECVQPGDVIQFEKVSFKGTDERGYTYTETFGHHTAIVWKVNDDGSIQLLHQNTGQTGRKVGITILRLRDFQRGKMMYYRPVKA